MLQACARQMLKQVKDGRKPGAIVNMSSAAAYHGEQMTFGRDYLIPKPFDPRLIGVVASAVAKAVHKARLRCTFRWAAQRLFHNS